VSILRNRPLITITIGLLFSVGLLHAQMYTINASKGMQMKLSGTSTQHKWQMHAKTLIGSAQFDFKRGGRELKSVSSMIFSLEVEKLKSGERELDRNAYRALKTYKYKDIFYQLVSAKLTAEKDGYLVSTNGNLTIAGVTKEVSMDLFCVVNKDGSITCKGSEQLKMRDYQVKLPAVMLGSMKKTDAINLDYTLVYKQ
jgi:polyisoprenoid-binding protein YceI